MLTKSDDKRWVWLASVISLIILGSLPMVIVAGGLGVLELGAIGAAWFSLYATVVLSATVWLYGEDAYRRWNGD